MVDPEVNDSEYEILDVSLSIALVAFHFPLPFLMSFLPYIICTLLLLQEVERAKDVGLFLSRAAKELSPLDMEVLSLVYGLKEGIPMKRAQVAKKLGLHASVVDKSEKRAIRKLREMLEIA